MSEGVHETLTVIAEMTLAVLLFSDAADMKLTRMRTNIIEASRMLGLGLPLAFLLGGLVSIVLFPQIGIWQALLLAALLTPTDAALGAPIFANKDVPVQVRDTLTAESGLNDGLALPFIIFLACAAIGEAHQFAQNGWLVFAVQQIGFGIVAGVVIGAVAGFILRLFASFADAARHYCAIFALLCVSATYFAAAYIEGNSFVAVFMAGIFFGRMAGAAAQGPKEFMDTEGKLLSMLAFFYVGAIFIPEGLPHVTLSVVIFVALSLFITRPLAIWISLARGVTDRRTKLFYGWFGPRGLATALFALFVLAEFDSLPGQGMLLAVTGLAVVSSSFLHGVTSYWAGSWFRQKETTAPSESSANMGSVE